MADATPADLKGAAYTFINILYIIYIYIRLERWNLHMHGANHTETWGLYVCHYRVPYVQGGICRYASCFA